MSSKTRPSLSTTGLVALLCAPFLTVMSAFSVMIAIPSIKAEFAASSGQISAIVAGYAVTYAAALILGGRLGDIVGRRRMFICGLLTFGLTACLCAGAADMRWLIAARVLQGLSAAAAFPQVLTIIRVQSGSDRSRSKAFAAFGIALGISGIAGQVMSGALIDADLAGLAWRSVFLLHPVIAVAACFVVWREVPETKTLPTPTLDIAGAALSSLGVGLLLFAAIGTSEADARTMAVAAFAAGLALLGLFARRQVRLGRDDRQPLVPIALFRAQFGRSLAVAGLFHTTVVAFPLSLAVFLQSGSGLSAWISGLFGLPITIAFLGASFASERVLAVWPRRRIMLCGGALTALGLAGCAATPLIATPELLIVPLLLVGWGQGWFLPLLLDSALSDVPPAVAGAGTGLLATMQQLGGGFGAVAANDLYFAALQASWDSRSTFFAAVLVPFAAAVVAVGLLPKPAPKGEA
jgi:MFS family permease